jgi:20S proteasome alpha/beta subunit
MTSILAIRANSGLEGIVIAADMQINIHSDKDDSPEEKITAQKIWYGENWALALAGSDDDEVQTLKKLLSGKARYKSSREKVNALIRKAVQSKRLLPIDLINKKLDDRGVEAESLVIGIFATTYPSIGLWHVTQYGTLQDYKTVCRNLNEYREFEYLVAGTGGPRIKRFISDRVDDSNDPLDPGDITVPKAILLAEQAFSTRAKRDIFTGSPAIDLVAITEKRGAVAYGKSVLEVINSAISTRFKEIAVEYQEDEEEPSNETPPLEPK